MNIEKIGQPVAVLASFSGGQATPLRFRWGSRTLKVDAVNGRWIDRQGEVFCLDCPKRRSPALERSADKERPMVKSLHYSVQSGGQTYYLHFSSEQVQWWLDQIITE